MGNDGRFYASMGGVTMPSQGMQAAAAQENTFANQNNTQLHDQTYQNHVVSAQNNTGLAQRE